MRNFIVKWNNKIIPIARKAAAVGLTQGMMIVQAKSMDNTPVDTGNLKSSQTVRPATAANLVATLFTDVPYAIPVHEVLTSKHPVGAAKFMELAVQSEGGKAMAKVAEKLREAL